MEIQTNLFKKQIEAYSWLTNPDWQGEIMYGGGARGGKSYLGCTWVTHMCISYPGSHWLIGFEELKHLRRTTLPDLIKVIDHNLKQISPDYKKLYNINQQDMVVTFWNGSIIYLSELANLPTDPNFDRLGSYSLTGVWIDEAQKVVKMAVDTLKGRLSLTTGPGWEFKPKSLYTCNPKRNWIYRDYYDPIIKQKRIFENKKFIVSLAKDNPHIDYVSYSKSILDTGNKIQIERLLYGNFDYDDSELRLYNYDCILNMFSNYITQPANVKKYIVLDIARFGKDSTIIQVWIGWELVEVIEITKSTLKFVVETIEILRDRYKIPKSQVMGDSDGLGAGVEDFGGYRGFVANSSPIDNREWQEREAKPLNYQNLKSQCGYGLVSIINNNLIKISANMTSEQKDKLVADLDSVEAYKIDNDSKQKLIPKEKQKEKLGRSPDYGDCFLIRYALELIQDNNQIIFID